MGLALTEQHWLGPCYSRDTPTAEQHQLCTCFSISYAHALPATEQHELPRRAEQCACVPAPRRGTHAARRALAVRAWTPHGCKLGT